MDQQDPVDPMDRKAIPDQQDPVGQAAQLELPVMSILIKIYIQPAMFDLEVSV